MRQNRAEGRELQDLDVVFVDDSRQEQAIMRSILAGARVGRIRGFDDAEEAHRAMLVEPPHVVITDWDMPGADGLTLVRSMRDPRSGPLTSVPVILVTTRPTRTLVEKAIGLGIHHVVAKPLSPASIVGRLLAIAHDARRFVLDEKTGHFALEDHEKLLAGQRQRWLDLLAGVRAFPSARDRAARPAPKPAAPTEEVAAAAPARPKQARLWGMGAPTRRESVETATGQAVGHAP